MTGTEPARIDRDRPISQWRSNTTPAELARWLAGSPSVLVLTHAKPDGDAIGSAIALVRTLRMCPDRTGHDPALTKAVFIGQPPSWEGEITNPDERDLLDTEPLDVIEPDAIVLVDTGAIGQLEQAGPFVSERADRAAIIDHHLSGSPELASRLLLDTTAAAAAVPVAELCMELLGVASASALPCEIAEPLYLGLATDTGWFRYSSVEPRTLRLAADLLEAGVDHTRLFAMVEQRARPHRVRLLARALGAMELHDGDRLAILPITARDVEETGVVPGESGGFADIALGIDPVRAAVVLTEVPGADPPMVKMSLRSKPGQAAIDVNSVAREFGGGGHARAAGARTRGNIEQIKARLIEIVQSQPR